MLQGRGLIDALETVGNSRPVVAENAAGRRHPKPVQMVDW